MSRKNPTPIAKPETVFLNAYREAAKHTRLGHNVGYDKNVKLGDCLAQLDERSAEWLWRDFITAIDDKFFEKDFSHEALWKVSLDHKVNPLHITRSIDHSGILGRNAARPNLIIYTDGAKKVAEVPELYDKLDTMLESALSFKAPYEDHAWFATYKPADLNREWIHLMSRNVGYGMRMLQTFLTHSRHAQTFCLTHVDDILEFAPDEEKTVMLGSLLDAITEVGFDLDSPDEYKLAPIDQAPLFEAVLSHMSAKMKPLNQLDAFSSSLFVGSYVHTRFNSYGDFSRICEQLGKTGLNEITASVALSEFNSPERFMTLAENLGSDMARALFSVTAASRFFKYTAEEQFRILNEYDDWFQNNGFGSVLTTDMLDRLTCDLPMAKLLADKGLADFPTYAQKPYFNHQYFCHRVQGERDSVFNSPDEVEEFVDLCKRVNAGDHIRYTLDEVLSKPNGDLRLRDEELKKAFIVAVLNSQVVEADEVMKTDKRVEKLVGMGISPALLKASKRYKGKWLDSSLGSDLGL